MMSGNANLNGRRGTPRNEPTEVVVHDIPRVDRLVNIPHVFFCQAIDVVRRRFVGRNGGTGSAGVQSVGPPLHLANIQRIVVDPPPRIRQPICLSMDGDIRTTTAASTVPVYIAVVWLTAMRINTSLLPRGRSRGKGEYSSQTSNHPDKKGSKVSWLRGGGTLACYSFMWN